MVAAVQIDGMVDIRCTHRLARSSARSRCQLLAGHDGWHAVMFCDRGRRTVRRWSAEIEPVDETRTVDETEGFESLPWVRGLPVPAWAA
jgi:hypothetical protein